MKLVGLFKLPAALAATSTKTVVTAALLAGVTSAATATVVVIGSNAISPTPQHAASGQPNDGFILGTKPGTTPLIVVPKSSASASSKPPHSASPSPTPSATPSATSTPATEPPHVVVIDNPGPTTTPAEPTQSSSEGSTDRPPPTPTPTPTPGHSHTPPPSKSPSPSPTPKPTPTPTTPSCGMFTSAEISWAAHELGISEGALKAAIKAHPAAICCLPKSGANCGPGDRADLVKLAKQVEALAHKSGDSGKGSDSGKGNNQGKDADNGKSNDHDADDVSSDKQGHDKSGCWHAS